MKVLTIGDPHFKHSNIIDMDKLTESIIKKAELIKPDLIVIMGDVLDRHANLHMVPLTRSIQFFTDLKKIAKLYVLIGNHDRKNNQDFLSEEHPFTAVEKWDDVVIVHKPIIDKICGKLFTFVPYVPPGRFHEALNHVKGWENSDCIFAHQEFYGCNNGCLFSLVGDKWDISLPLCVSGHIHDFCILQENLIYVGTPHQNSFGEKTDKTISLFEFSETFSHDRIELDIPKKITHEITFEEIKDYDLNFNDHNKIIIVGDPGELKSLSKHPNIIKWKKSGAIIILRAKFVNEVKNNKNGKKFEQKNFFENLLNKMSPDEKIMKTFTNYFGSITDFKLNPIPFKVEATPDVKTLKAKAVRITKPKVTCPKIADTKVRDVQSVRAKKIL